MNNQLSYPPPGSIISVSTHLLYRHKGIVSDRWHDGKPMVISCSARAGAVVEESWLLFAQGAAVQVEQRSGPLTEAQTVYRARSYIGKPYQVLTWNCEHLVTTAQGYAPRSPQLAATLVIGLIALVASAR